MQGLLVRPATIEDAEGIASIYNHYVLDTTISFEAEAVPVAGMADRIREVLAAELPWLVATGSGRAVGYAYAAKWKGRCAYRYSVESSVYLDPAFTRRGVGTALYQALLGILKARSIHVVIGGIALPNEASVALHERLGFSKVAHFRQIGYKFDRWIDVGYWQRTP